VTVLKAVEIARHQLSVAVRLDDHFTGEPVKAELQVSLSTREAGVKAASGSLRHADGTYRFLDLANGPRDVKVTVPDNTAFTWTPVTPITIPLADARVPVVIEVWPSPKAVGCARGARPPRGGERREQPGSPDGSRQRLSTAQQAHADR